MATGLHSKLTGQIGEHLVTAELGRRGIIATPFAGNVPDIDILAYRNGVTSYIQVKTINKDSWQFDIRKFLDVKLTPKGQNIRGLNAELDRKMICVFVSLGDELGKDEFYIFRLGWLQDYFLLGDDGNKKYGGRTTKSGRNIESFHCAIWKSALQKHLGKWQIITNKFKV